MKMNNSLIDEQPHSYGRWMTIWLCLLVSRIIQFLYAHLSPYIDKCTVYISDHAILLSPLLLIFLLYMWNWAGRALPPASVIDWDCLKKRRDEKKAIEDSESISLPEASPLPLDSAKIGETMTIASTHMYVEGPPTLNTVEVRAYIIKFVGALFFFLLWENFAHDRIEILKELVLGHQVMLLILAASTMVLATLIGAYRQLCKVLLSKAGAIPVLGKNDQPRFAYLGDVPHNSWQHSPWYRAGSWAIVVILSFFSAFAGAIFMEEWLGGAFFVLSFWGILIIRWLISAIPRL